MSFIDELSPPSLPTFMADSMMGVTHEVDESALPNHSESDSDTLESDTEIYTGLKILPWYM